MIRIGHRFMSGQLCTTTGDYEFDGYADASTSPPLSDEQKCISVTAGCNFPPASAARKNAYWKFTGFSY